MGFIDSYKHLDKLCRDVLGSIDGVSAYIKEMQNTINGTYYVDGWNEDLKNLKHYRWVRNQISHEPGCTEQNMCDPKDELWLDAFYSRIMNQTDPLCVYNKGIQHNQRKAKTIEKGFTYTYPEPISDYPEPAKNQIGCFNAITVSVLIMLGLILLLAIIK